MKHESVRVTVHSSFETEDRAQDRAARFAFFFVIEVDDFSIALPVTIEETDPGQLETVRQAAIRDFRSLLHQIADAPVAIGVATIPELEDSGAGV
ncbi:hypothetical protein [Roseibium sp. MMSF_3412]|uniref:hypothetical protein n=1 Tax=Roseibium sp. MMSF_3412 TaxID=3046712 RepID=UPI00273FBDA4|nr:hypothetical protein [Roseibium sp. MMSF_3412]